jgi:hypothetical protein
MHYGFMASLCKIPRKRQYSKIIEGLDSNYINCLPCYIVSMQLDDQYLKYLESADIVDVYRGTPLSGSEKFGGAAVTAWELIRWREVNSFPVYHARNER